MCDGKLKTTYLSGILKVTYLSRQFCYAFRQQKKMFGQTNQSVVQVAILTTGTCKHSTSKYEQIHGQFKFPAMPHSPRTEEMISTRYQISMDHALQKPKPHSSIPINDRLSHKKDLYKKIQTHDQHITTIYCKFGQHLPSPNAFSEFCSQDSTLEKHFSINLSTPGSYYLLNTLEPCIVNLGSTYPSA